MDVEKFRSYINRVFDNPEGQCTCTSWGNDRPGAIGAAALLWVLEKSGLGPEQIRLFEQKVNSRITNGEKIGLNWAGGAESNFYVGCLPRETLIKGYRDVLREKS